MEQTRTGRASLAGLRFPIMTASDRITVPSSAISTGRSALFMTRLSIAPVLHWSREHQMRNIILFGASLLLLAGCSSTPNYYSGQPMLTGQAAMRTEAYNAAYAACLQQDISVDSDEFTYCLTRHGVHYQPVQSPSQSVLPTYSPSYAASTYSSSLPRSSSPGCTSPNQYGAISCVTYRPKTTYVRGYTRKDGTYVRPHYRSRK